MTKEVYCPILEKFKKENKTPVLFIGSGFSKRYLKNFYNWWELLVKVGSELGLSEFILKNKYDLYTRNYDDGLSKQKIGTDLENRLNELIETGKIDNIFSQEEQTKIINESLNPFKFLVSRILSTDLDFINDPKKKYLNTEINHFKKLVNKVPCIITTNYDKLIETLFANKFNLYVNQSDYFYNGNFSNAEIYKIHGSVEQPNSIIITERDYKEFERKSHLTTAKLLTILSTYPIIFIGYSFSDSDIVNIIDKLVECLTLDKIKLLKDNLVFISWKPQCRQMYSNNTREIKTSNNNIFNLTFVETDNFTRLFIYLNSFNPVVSPIEIRKFQMTLRNLILKNDSELQSFIGKESDLEKLPETTAIEGVGPTEEAYNKFSATKLMLDVLYEKNDLDSFKILKKWFVQSTGYNTNAPIYYYLKKCLKHKVQYNEEILKDEKLMAKLHKFLQNKKNIKIQNTTLYKSVTALDAAVKKEINLPKKLQLLNYNFYNDMISREQFRQRLICILEEEKGEEDKVMNIAEFKKGILLLDYDPKIKI